MYIEPCDYPYYLSKAHQNSARIHLSGQQTAQSLLRLGVFWPSVHEDAHSFVKESFEFRLVKPVHYGTFYQVMVAPKWDQYIVDFLQTHILLANTSSTRREP